MENVQDLILVDAILDILEKVVMKVSFWVIVLPPVYNAIFSNMHYLC